MKNDMSKLKRQKNDKHNYPSGWDEKRVRKVLEHYENQTDEEAVAEDEAAYETQGQTVMIIPSDLVPKVRRLIARRGA
jgi:hypothetical protein